MTRTNGTPSTAASAGKPADPGPQAQAPRSTVPPAIARRIHRNIAAEVAAELQIEPLELRARAWHFEMIGAGCPCHGADRYPCNECLREADDLLQLLRSVTDDAIRAAARMVARQDEIPRGKR